MSRLVTLLAVLLLCAFAVSDSTAHQFPWGDGTPAAGDLPDPNEDHPWGGDGAPEYGGETFVDPALDGSDRTTLTATSSLVTGSQTVDWFLDISGMGLWLQEMYIKLFAAEMIKTTGSSSSTTVNDRVSK